MPMFFKLETIVKNVRNIIGNCFKELRAIKAQMGFLLHRICHLVT